MDFVDTFSTLPEEVRRYFRSFRVTIREVAKAEIDGIRHWFKNASSVILWGPENTFRQTLAILACMEVGYPYEMIKVSVDSYNAVINKINSMAGADDLVRLSQAIIIQGMESLPFDQTRTILTAVDNACIPCIYVLCKPPDKLFETSIQSCHYVSPEGWDCFIECTQFELIIFACKQNRFPHLDLQRLCSGDLCYLFTHVEAWTDPRFLKGSPTRVIKVCQSGDEMFRRRDKKYFKAIGVRIVKSVNPSVTWMVISESLFDANIISNKMKKAQALGIQIITELDFYLLVHILRYVGKRERKLIRWRQILNSTMKRHKAMATDPHEFYSFLIITDELMSPDVNFIRNCFTFWEIYPKLDNQFGNIDRDMIRSDRDGRNLRVSECCTDTISIIGIRGPTKKMLTTAVSKFLKLKSAHKFIIYAGEKSADDLWEIQDGFMNSYEFRKLLKATKVPEVGACSLHVFFDMSPRICAGWLQNSNEDFISSNIDKTYFLKGLGFSQGRPADFMEQFITTMYGRIQGLRIVEG